MANPVVLSGSSLAAFNRCAQQWAFENIERRPHGQSVRQVIGVATHSAAETNFSRKIETENDEPLDVILDVYSTSFDSEITNVEKPEEPIGKGKDAGVGLVKVFHRDVAPPIKPLWVERSIQYEIDGIPFSGYIDLVDKTDSGMRVRDLKTTARKPNAPAYTSQMIGYALGYRQATGETEVDVVLDFLVRRKLPGYEPIAWGGPISNAAISGFAREVRTTSDMIAAGLFPTTGVVNHMCGTCPFIDICPAWRGRITPKEVDDSFPW
jgi:hypothetical protein